MHIKLLELLFIVVVVLGIGVWQLYDVTRALKEHDEEAGGKGSDQAPNAGSDDDQADPPARD